MTDSSPVPVSVIIPTLDGEAMLRHALRALSTQTYRDFEVIVVDNGSSDGTQEMMQREFPSTKVIALDRNVGFAAAVNHGIRASRSEVVVLLNNDTEAHPEWLARLIEPLWQDASVASCASRILDFHRRDRIDSAGDRLGLVASQIGHGDVNGPRYDLACDVLSPCAAAAAYRRVALVEIGAFDEWYVSYLEDVDVGVRLMLAGYRCRYVPGAIVYHHGSVTAQRLPDERFFLVMRNQLTLFLRYMPWSRLVLGLPVMCLMPFAAAVRDGHSFRTAMRALVAALRAWPSIVPHRARMRQAPRDARRRFVGVLAPPWTWQRRPAA